MDSSLLCLVDTDSVKRHERSEGSLRKDDCYGAQFVNLLLKRN